jgi:hypothetical protein
MDEKGVQKFTFLEALFVCILIFGLGILAGIWLESYRESKITSLYSNAEISLLDMKSTENFIELVSCDKAASELVNFADRIYNEAKLLEKYDGASRLSESLIATHRRYDLLRASLFLAALKTRNRCNSTYHIITYFYDYLEPTIETSSEQNVFSKYLLELKKSKPGQEIILIPIAADNNLASVDIILQKYNITKLPTILVNENLKVTEIEDLDKIKIWH